MARSERPIRLPLTKLFFDKLVVLALLPVLIPIALLVSLALKIESLLGSASGPVFHTETRISQGRPFLLVKFRILNSWELEKLISEGANPKNIERNKANLSPVGRFLKKYGLDELPQFYNVLKGDMTLVGPRPKPVSEYEAQLADGYQLRRRMRAGLTGPAQVLKGTRRAFADEMRADLEYSRLVEKGRGLPVLAEDLRLIKQTLRVMVSGSGE